MNLIMIRCNPLNKDLITRADDLADRLLSGITSDNIRRCHRLQETFKKIQQRISKKNMNAEELVESEAYMKEVRSKQLGKLKADVNEVKRRLRFLFDNNFTVEESVLGPIVKAFKASEAISSVIDNCEDVIAADRDRIESNFKTKRDEFVVLLSEIGSQVAGLVSAIAHVGNVLQKHLETEPNISCHVHTGNCQRNSRE